MKLPSTGRRGFLKSALAIVAGSALAPMLAAAADLPRLVESDPAAKALGYVEHAAKLDPAKEPTFQKGRQCSGCALYQAAQEKGGYAPCAAFPGKQVSAKGWCRAFTPKPAA